jgi:hypothetical protein
MIPVAPTSHERNRWQILGVVLLRVLAFSDKPIKPRFIFEYDSTELRGHVRKPVFVAGSPWIVWVSKVSPA